MINFFIGREPTSNRLSVKAGNRVFLFGNDSDVPVTVSEVHCQLTVHTDNRLELKNLKNYNYTYVNDNMIANAFVSEDDVISLGPDKWVMDFKAVIARLRQEKFITPPTIQPYEASHRSVWFQSLWYHLHSQPFTSNCVSKIKLLKDMNIAVFASGTGTTLQTLIDKQAQYDYCVALVVSNRECAALERAAKYEIPSLHTKDWEEIDKALADNNIQLIVLAGYLAIIPAWICQKWEKRIINIHPSLLPKFGGKGMYGIHVQEAVLAAGEKETGCTVHHVSAEVDGGSIIAQATISVEPQDTAESLSLRVQQAEKVLLPKVVGELVKG